MKWWLIIAGVLAAGTIGVWYVMNSPPERVIDSGYKTSEIERGNLENIVSSTGTLSAVSTVNIGSQVSGTLETVNVDFNDRVKKGQVLAELDTLLFEASVRDTQANLFKSKAQFAQAKAELERNRELYEKGFISESEFLTFKTDLDVKKATVSASESSLFRAQTNLSYCVIKSPIDGIVIQRSVDPGQTIAASLQTPQLFIIAEDLSNMEIEVYVDESDIGYIEEGMPLRFEVQAYPELVFEGMVKQIRLQPETISNVVNYTVIVSASNPDRKLLPGMTATVDFVVDSVTDAILVPNSAIKYRPDRDLMASIRRLDHEGGRFQGREDSDNEAAKADDTLSSSKQNATRIFLLNDAGQIEPFVFITGVTDGAFTEVQKIIRGPSDPVGRHAITSSNGVKTNQRPKGMISMGGPPPGGRGMRRSGL